MRIGYVVSHFPPLTETFIRREVLALCEAGDEVVVYAETMVSDPLVGMPSHPRLMVRHTAFGTALAGAARRDRIDHLHGTLMLRAQQAAADAARTLGISYSITAYSGYSVFTTRGDIYRKMTESPLCAGMVVEDEFMRDYMLSHHGVDAARLKVIANSLELDAYPAATHGERERPRILAIARFVPKKGLLQLVQAFGRLRAKRAAELHLIGSGPEGQPLRQAAADIPDVHFLGLQPEARCREEYARADIFAAPCVVGPDGDADGIPTVVLEAMACGLPVVVSNLLSAPSYVRDGVEGALVPPGDVEALAGRLEELCADDSLRAQLGANGRHRVEELCDIRRNIESLRAVFRAKARPLVSVCISAYNRSHLVAQAIESVLRQTYSPIEIVVVNDGSTDGTAEVIGRYGDRVRTINHEKNRGSAAAKNSALRASSPDAKYVALLDSDDWFLPTFVARCVQHLEHHPEHGFVYVNEITVDDSGREVHRRRDAEPWSIEHWLRTCHLRGDTWMARRELVMATELHDEELPMDDDYDLFYQLLERTTFVHVPEPLVMIRRHGQQKTRDALTLARCHAAHLVKYGYSPEYAYLRARRNPEWVPAIEEGVAIGARQRERRERQRSAQ